MIVAFDNLLEDGATAGCGTPVSGKFVIVEVTFFRPPNNATEGGEWYTVIFKDTEKFDLGEYIHVMMGRRMGPEIVGKKKVSGTDRYIRDNGVHIASTVDRNKSIDPIVGFTLVFFIV